MKMLCLFVIKFPDEKLFLGHYILWFANKIDLAEIKFHQKRK